MPEEDHRARRIAPVLLGVAQPCQPVSVFLHQGPAHCLNQLRLACRARHFQEALAQHLEYQAVSAIGTRHAVMLGDVLQDVQRAQVFPGFAGNRGIPGQEDFTALQAKLVSGIACGATFFSCPAFGERAAHLGKDLPVALADYLLRRHAGALGISAVGTHDAVGLVVQENKVCFRVEGRVPFPVRLLNFALAGRQLCVRLLQGGAGVLKFANHGLQFGFAPQRPGLEFPEQFKLLLDGGGVCSRLGLGHVRLSCKAGNPRLFVHCKL